MSRDFEETEDLQKSNETPSLRLVGMMMTDDYEVNTRTSKGEGDHKVPPPGTSTILIAGYFI
jgi:hypothetical protein